MSVNSKMTAIADKIRTLLGLTGTMGLDAMAANVDDANTAVTAALTALTEKGVTVPEGTNVTGLADLIAAIEAGGGDIAYGTVTPTSNSAATVTHNLGVIPTKGIFVNTSATVTSQSDMFALYQHATEPGTRVFSYNSKITSANIPDGWAFTKTLGTYYFYKADASTVKTPDTIVAGNTYFWAVMK